MESLRQLGGLSPWMFSYDTRPDHWDAFTFYYKTGSALSDPVNRYADILYDIAQGRSRAW